MKDPETTEWAPAGHWALTSLFVPLPDYLSVNNNYYVKIERLKPRYVIIFSLERVIELTYSGRNKDYQEFKKAPAKGTVGSAVASFARQLYSFKSLKIIYTIDRTGAFKELKNGPQVREYITNAVKTFQEDQNVSPDFKSVLKQFAPSFLSDDYILYSFLVEVQAFHQLYGTKWSIGKQTYDIELPNPINGEPLPGILTTELRKEQKGAQSGATSYELVMQQEIDSDKITEVIADKTAETYQKINKPNPVHNR